MPKPKNALEDQVEESEKVVDPSESEEGVLDLPEEMEPVTLTKVLADESGPSETEAGRSYKGIVLGKIEVGQGVFIGSMNTSPVTEISRGEVDGEFLIKTASGSVYKLEHRERDSDGAVVEEEIKNIEKAPEPLKDGEKVRIQKRSMINPEEPLGDIMEMTLTADVKEGGQIVAISEDDMFETSIVNKLNSEDGKFYAQTASGSLYVVERVA